MDPEAIGRYVVYLRIALPLLMLLVPFAVGTWIERRHLRSLARRERITARFPMTTLEAPPDDWRVAEVGLVTGSVVVSLDYWKRLAAGLRSIFGGRLRGFEGLLTRARREALLRLKEAAHASGYHAVVNVRLETAGIARMRRDGEGTTGVEVLAFGTGVKRRGRSLRN